MSTEASVVHVDAQELRDLAALALTGRGATLAHARIQADHLVAAELRVIRRTASGAWTSSSRGSRRG